jgi:hypothetical protein
VRGQEPPRRVAVADLPARDRAERDGRVGRPEGRRAELGGADIGELGEGPQRVQVAGLALVDCHAAGRVALQELDVAVAFLQRDFCIGDSDVVQEIEPLAVAAPVRRERDGLRRR